MKERLSTVTLTPYEHRNRHAVRDLLFRSYRTHTHLDWHETDEWLESAEKFPMRLAWQNGRMIGALAASVPLNGTCWIRLAAISDQVDAATLLGLLWTDLKADLRGLGVNLVALLLVRNWLAAYAPTLGFHFSEEIITYRRPDLPIPEDNPPPGLSIRLSQPADLAALVDVDNAAFAPPWQMDAEELRQAVHISACCTVAQRENSQIVGYQLSTLYFDGSHLARLAVTPEMQHQGLARALLSDVLRRFERRGVRSMTVNTQSSNHHSQRLYIGYGFERNGYDLPVWLADL